MVGNNLADQEGPFGARLLRQFAAAAVAEVTGYRNRGRSGTPTALKVNMLGDPNLDVAAFFERRLVRASWFWGNLIVVMSVLAMVIIMAWRRWPLHCDLFRFLELGVVPVLVISEFVNSVGAYSELKAVTHPPAKPGAFRYEPLKAAMRGR